MRAIDIEGKKRQRRNKGFEISTNAKVSPLYAIGSHPARRTNFYIFCRPTSIKTDKVDKNIKDQLHKKISTLENEVDGLKTALTEQISINETHKVQAAEDFDKWKKMKHWQQTAERLKNKLKERDGEFEKIQQTSVGYR